jgi:hypothetical protein
MVTRESRYEHADGRRRALTSVGLVAWFQVLVLALLPAVGVPHLHVESGGETPAARVLLQHTHGIGLEHADPHEHAPVRPPTAVQNLDDEGLFTYEEHDDCAAAARTRDVFACMGDDRLEDKSIDRASVLAAPPRALGHRAEVRLAPQRRGPPAASD